MFGSIYKKIRNDFSFLNGFGFFYDYDCHHNVMPSVVFSDGERSIQVGMHYEDHKIFFVLYHTKGQLRGNDILENINLPGESYSTQVYKVIDYVKSNFNQLW